MEKDSETALQKGSPDQKKRVTIYYENLNFKSRGSKMTLPPLLKLLLLASTHNWNSSTEKKAIIITAPIHRLTYERLQGLARFEERGHSSAYVE